MRNMSFLLTVDAFVAGRKTVTRRLGWAFLKPGDRVRAVERCMGLKKGEKVKVLGVIEVVSNRAERLDAITAEDCALEGFEGMLPSEFVAMFLGHVNRNRSRRDWADGSLMVQRIEYRRLCGVGEG